MSTQNILLKLLKGIEMTLERLQQYGIIVEQIELIKREYIPSYITAVDTSKSSVQNSNISDITADIAIQQMNIDPAIKKEYARLKQELKELNDFIFNIKDELIRAIVIRRFIPGKDGKVMIWDDIARDLHYSKKYCQKLMKSFAREYLNNAPI